MTATGSEADDLLARMPPEVAALMSQMMARSASSWTEARALRDEIVRLNGAKRSDEEQAALAFAFVALMDHVEKHGLVAEESLPKFRGLREADYRMILNVQAMNGDLIDPVRLEKVTRREVEAGRLAEDDDFRKLAIAGAAVLGEWSTTSERKSWLQRLFGG